MDTDTVNDWIIQNQKVKKTLLVKLNNFEVEKTVFFFIEIAWKI